jgi:hypothetical protein
VDTITSSSSSHHLTGAASPYSFRRRRRWCCRHTITSSSSSHHHSGAASPYSFCRRRRRCCRLTPTVFISLMFYLDFPSTSTKEFSLFCFDRLIPKNKINLVFFSIFISSNDPTTNGNFDLNWLKN